MVCKLGHWQIVRRFAQRLWARHAPSIGPVGRTEPNVAPLGPAATPSRHKRARRSAMPATPSSDTRSAAHKLFPLALPTLLFASHIGPGPSALFAQTALAASPAAVPRPELVASGARLSGNRERTRLVVDLSRHIKESELDVFTLARPYRVVIDMPAVEFRLPTGLGRKGKGLVHRFHYGTYVAGRARIVVEVAGPVRVANVRVAKSGIKSSIIGPARQAPAQLVLEIVPSTPERFLRVIEERRRWRPRIRLEAPAKASTVDSARDGRTVIVIDPGHGGIDSGAISRNGTLEKFVVLRFAKLLRKKLLEHGHDEVILTRDHDVYVPLGKRVTFAQSKKADLFISLHADFVSRRWAKKARGATVYTLSDRASDQISRELEQHANRSDIIAGVEFAEESQPVRKILVDLLRRETNLRTLAFAGTLVDELRRATRLKQEPHRSAAFRVLKAPEIPSVLIELGYLSNAIDEKLLKSQAWREKVAEQIAVAVDKYLEQRVAKLPY